MFFQCSNKPFFIDPYLLKKFVKSCHWQYLRKYNLFGHHNLGWGFAYLDENQNLKIKRDISPIYKADWKGLTNIKTRFLLVHARKAYPWKKDFKNIHPINIQEKYLITHNGVIKTDSFPPLSDTNLEKIRLSDTLDTRRYLCSISDKIRIGVSLKNALEEIFKNIQIAAGANAFLFNSNECNVISYHNSNFNGRHHTLFMKSEDNYVLVSTTPILKHMKEIANKSLIKINFSDLSAKFMKMDI